MNKYQAATGWLLTATLFIGCMSAAAQDLVVLAVPVEVPRPVECPPCPVCPSESPIPDQEVIRKALEAIQAAERTPGGVRPLGPQE